jgi:hypothetical protein
MSTARVLRAMPRLHHTIHFATLESRERRSLAKSQFVDSVLKRAFSRNYD